MTNSEQLEMLEHDLAANIRNFEVANGLLCSPDSDLALAKELFQASIEQLKDTHKWLLKSGLKKDLQNKPSQAAQKKGGGTYEKVSE